MSWLTKKEWVDNYIFAMKEVVKNDARFNLFRQDRHIRDVIEGIPDVVGLGYYNKLKDTDFFKQNIEKIRQNDEIGRPKLALFDDQAFASTTLRYAWNVHDMNVNDVALDNVDIVEVGGGYGGLARMIHAFHTPKSYTMIDLPEALAMAKRYLESYGILNVKYVSAFEYGELPIDTFISNYALTEHRRNTQVGYVENYLKKADHGYVTYNSQTWNAAEQYSLLELQDSVPSTSNSHIQQENIKKSECQVLIWRPNV